MPWNCSTRGDPATAERDETQRGREGESGDDDEEEDPVLKNADEAEVKESCTRRKSQADLVTVHPRPSNDYLRL